MLFLFDTLFFSSHLPFFQILSNILGKSTLYILLICSISLNKYQISLNLILRIYEMEAS